MASKSVNITLPEMPQVEVKMYGEWQKVDMLIHHMAPNVLQAYHYSAQRCAKHIMKIVRKAILTGRPPLGARWTPLSPSTIRTHGEHDIYNLNGHYAKSIGLHQYPGRIIVGVPVNMKLPPGKNGKIKNLTMNQLAILLEHGSKMVEGASNDIPARPLWAPSFKEYGGKERLKKEILRDIRRNLIRNFGLHSNQIRQAR